MAERAEKCRAWTGNKETWQRRKKEDHRSLPGNGWSERSGKETSGTAFRRYAAEGGDRQSTGGRAGNPVYG